jgi:hypothetical protein
MIFLFTGVYNLGSLLFSFACLGLGTEAQLLNCSGGIYVLKVFINSSMPVLVHCAESSLDAILRAPHRRECISRYHKFKSPPSLAIVGI